jgi:hypothetical protein
MCQPEKMAGKKPTKSQPKKAWGNKMLILTDRFWDLMQLLLVFDSQFNHMGAEIG